MLQMLLEPWYYGFCSCFRGGCSNCLGLTFCTCCQYGRALDLAFGDSCVVCCLMFPLFGIGICLTCCKRQEVRAKYNLEVCHGSSRTLSSNMQSYDQCACIHKNSAQPLYLISNDVYRDQPWRIFSQHACPVGPCVN